MINPALPPSARSTSESPFRTLYPKANTATTDNTPPAETEQNEDTRKQIKEMMALNGSGDEWRTPDTDPPNTLGHGETIDNLIGGGNWRNGPPAVVHSTTNTTSEQHPGQKMWTVGGGKDGYDQLGDARIADDPVLSIFLRNDEVESHNCGAGVRDV